jgi:hypothetical protein
MNSHISIIAKSNGHASAIEEAYVQFEDIPLARIRRALEDLPEEWDCGWTDHRQADGSYTQRRVIGYREPEVPGVPCAHVSARVDLITGVVEGGFFPRFSLRLSLNHRFIEHPEDSPPVSFQTHYAVSEFTLAEQYLLRFQEVVGEALERARKQAEADAEGPPRTAHSRSEYRRLILQGENVWSPAPARDEE